MKRKTLLYSLFWLVAAVGFAYMSSLGGDNSKVGGWLYLLITLPFGIIWQFSVVEHIQSLFPDADLYLIGQVFVIGIGYIFWFLLIPALKKWSSSNGE